jgi:formate-dependent phosphoribosylglycinamide formyltransferase (GAR transformylase)/SAM-dependent methyltransferase
MDKKLLFLGGSDIQVMAINRAKELGYFVVICDYNPDCPGRLVGDKFFNISTTNVDEVLSVAKDEDIDGVIAYASDPAAFTAAYVSSALGLPGNSPESVKILSNKDRFRKFMKKNGYLHPVFSEASSSNDVSRFVKKNGKAVVKPVDTSGSKGVAVVDYMSDFEEAFDTALSFSRAKKVMVERFIKKVGPQLCGDVLVVDGKVVFSKYGDVHFDDDCNHLVPCSITVPSEHSVGIFKKIDEICQDIFNDLNVKCGTFNVDILVEDDKVYIVEIGARNGGNLLTEVISMQSGYDLSALTLSAAVSRFTENEALDDMWMTKPVSDCCAHYVIHSDKNGILDNIIFDDSILKNIVYKKIDVNFGDKVSQFNGSNNRLGICIFKFDSIDEMNEKIKNMKNNIHINLINNIDLKADINGIYIGEESDTVGAKFHKDRNKPALLRELSSDNKHQAYWETPYYNKFIDKSLHEVDLTNLVCLDIGCGDGRFAEYLVSKGAKNVICLDADYNALLGIKEYSEAAGFFEKLTLINSGAEKIPLKDNFVDVALSVGVFYYLGEKYKIGIENVYGKIKKGGMLISSEPSLIGIALRALLFDSLEEVISIFDDKTFKEISGKTESRFPIKHKEDIEKIYESIGFKKSLENGISIFHQFMRILYLKNKISDDQIDDNIDNIRNIFDTLDEKGAIYAKTWVYKWIK